MSQREQRARGCWMWRFGGVGLVMARLALAQGPALPRFCIPGTNPDGHPLFGTPAVRVDVQDVGGVPYWENATHAAFGDLNGDGLPDMAVTGAQWHFLDNHISYVSVCMNLGNGVFGPPTIYSAGLECCAVEMGDFNHDGHLDLAVVNASDNTVSILFNRGDGTLAPPVNYPVGNQPRSLQVGDLNGDGWPDIVTLDCLSNDVSVLFNRGDGTFAPEVRVPVGGVTQRGNLNLTFPYPGPFLALGDFNGDHAPDIAVPANGVIKLLMNDGTGGFTPAPVSPPVVSSLAYCIAVGDLNHDGKQDLAVAVTGSGGGPPNASVLLGRGDGTFEPAVAYDVAPWTGPGAFIFTTSIAIGDLEGRGFPDLVIGHEYSHGRATLLRNRGDGTFLPKEFINTDEPCWFVALRDLRGTGRPDFATLGKRFGSELRVVLNDGSGGLLGTTYSPPFPSPNETESFYGSALGDLDGDGVADVAATVFNKPYQLQLFHGLGGGRFALQSTVSFGPMGQSAGGQVVTADLNGDGRRDLIVTDTAEPGGSTHSGTIWVLLNAGEFTFAPPVGYPTPGDTPLGIVAADLNGDGHPDLAVWTTQVLPGPNDPPLRTRRLQVLINRGDGTFDPPVAYTIASLPVANPGCVLATDLDRDGRPDLLGLVCNAWG